MLIYADFDQLNLDQLDSLLREKILSLHSNNEFLYRSIYQEDIEKVKELLSLGFPMDWKTALQQFTKDEQFLLETFDASTNPDISGCTDNLGICFDNKYRGFESVFYKKNHLEYNRELVDVLAQFYFARDDFREFKFFYFVTAKDKEITTYYIKKLIDKDNYQECLNGLFFNVDSSFFDIFLDLKKDKKLKNLLNIFRRPHYSYLTLNESVYKHAFDLYIDSIIEDVLNRKDVKNVVAYTRTHAINEVFRRVYVNDKTRSHIYDKYQSLTGVKSRFTPLALAYSEIAAIDVYFDLEWEKMNDSFKEKYPKEKDLSKSNKRRRKNFLERYEKEFQKVMDNFCQSHNWYDVAQQCKDLGIAEKYYPELYYKYKLENLLSFKDRTEIVQKI